MVNQPVLIVDDEVEMRIAMSETLKHCGYPVEISHNAIDALKKFKQNEYSLVITDMTMPKRSGLELLKDIKSISPAKPVIMATAYGTVETAVEAMKHGAFDYIRKPINFDSFQFIVQQALNYKGTADNSSLVAESRSTKSKPLNLSKEIITQNQSMLSLLDVARNVAKSKSTMMIQSESGTGKELLANFIHENSDRSKRPFVRKHYLKVNSSDTLKELLPEQFRITGGNLNRLIQVQFYWMKSVRWLYLCKQNSYVYYRNIKLTKSVGKSRFRWMLE
jgi:DNA-binding NtrC family response regulator